MNQEEAKDAFETQLGELEVHTAAYARGEYEAVDLAEAIILFAPEEQIAILAEVINQMGGSPAAGLMEYEAGDTTDTVMRRYLIDIYIGTLMCRDPLPSR